jgi:hypothetical protein
VLSAIRLRRSNSREVRELKRPVGMIPNRPFYMGRVSDFGYRDGLLVADFDAAFTAQTFISPHRNGLAVLQFIDIHRAHFNTLFITDAFFGIYLYFKHCRNLYPLKSINFVA